MSKFLQYFRSYRNLARFHSLKKIRCFSLSNFPKNCTRISHLLVADVVYNVSTLQDELLEKKLETACQEGELALIELMKELKECILGISKQYRLTLQKQIDVTKIAAKLGALSEKWDELPALRLLADDLNNELNNHLTIFKTIGQMAYDQTLISVLTQNEIDLQKIVSKYKELEVLILHEFSMNKRKEIEYLNVKRDNIVNELANVRK